LRKLRAAIANGAAIAVAGFTPADPTGYGRLIIDNSRLIAIREHNDASEAERAIGLCNGGLMALDGRQALALLDRIGNANAKQEYYLTDAVALANDAGLHAVAVEVEEDDVRGVNTKAQLAETEAVLQRRLRQAALDAGVTMIAPETVFLSADTRLANDVTIEPYVFFGPGVTVEAGAVIH
jgi:bifunctional UDP-N-acetylglucosamine pyrophosphorylase/glucosamine-1-phosphate N-acetyltransferase